MIFEQNTQYHDTTDELVINLNSNYEEEPCAHTQMCSEALILSLSHYGIVDISYISKITGKTIETIIKELKGSIFLDPAKWDHINLDNGWVTKEEYLSGNLFEKYQLANFAAQEHPEIFLDNAEALKQVMPNKMPEDSIFVTLGTPWIPVSIIEDFIKSVLKRYTSRVLHDELTGSWEIVNKHSYAMIINSTYGTDKMNALHILEKTLNMQNIVVKTYKFILNSNGQSQGTYMIDEKETAFALEKQKLLVNKFQSWIWEDINRKNLIIDIYYRNFVCNRKRYFDGSFLNFPNLNPKIQLYDYQKNAIARMILAPNTLLAHDVGSGKTYEMIAAGHEAKRMGLSKKNMFVIPNNIVEQWQKFYKNLYPNEKILVVTNKNFNPGERKNTLHKMISEDYDAILITYSCFGLIPLSPEFYIEQLKDKVGALLESSQNVNTCTKTVNMKLSNCKKSAVNRYNELMLQKANSAGEVFFEDLKIDRLFVDEAHNFKNVPFESKCHNILGLNQAGSKKCQEMMDKVHYIQKQHNGGGIVFATGTPITNSISDVYVIQQYLQSAELSLLCLGNFDAWAKMFAEITTNFEIDVTTANFRMATRFSKFHNLPELSALLVGIADFHHIDKDNNLPDFNGYKDIVLPKNDEFDVFLKDISLRADAIKQGKPRILSPINVLPEKLDNMLVITGDGRKAALDLRLFDSQNYVFNPDGKVNQCAKEVYKIYLKYNEDKLTQLIFCDVSTPKQGFNIYDELKHLLIFYGIPNNEIAYVHDANSDAQRNVLFHKVQNGEIRVLIGSTFKLGLGVNVQNKLIAIHHIDIPWRPSDMIQREGRILRPGNNNKEVFIYRYIMQHSFDAYSWQLLETKQRFISKLLSNEVNERDATDIDDTVLNYAEVKALAIGNPLIKERVEVANELERLHTLQSKLIEKHLKLQSQISFYKDALLRLEKNIELTKLDQQYYQSLNVTNIKSEAQYRQDLRKTIFQGLQSCLFGQKEKVLASYRGFDIIGGSSLLNNKQYLYLQKNNKYRIEASESEVGILIKIDNFLNGFDNYIKNLQTNYQNNLDFIKDAEKELTKEETYIPQINACTIKLKSIDKMLGVEK